MGLYDDEYPTVETSALKIFELYQVRSNIFMTEEKMFQMLRNYARLTWELDRMRKTMWLQLRSQVLEDPDWKRKKTLRFEEAPRFESWKHHLVWSLPEDSFRRRFLTYFWNLEGQTLGKRIVHEVVIERHLLYPDADVPMHHPAEFGEPQRIYPIHTRTVEEEL